MEEENHTTPDKTPPLLDYNRFLQAYNNSTDRWVKIDRKRGRIVENKKTPGPYKNIPTYKKPNNQGDKKDE